MKRRDLLKRAVVGVGAVVAAPLALAKVKASETLGYSQAIAPEWKEPPLDMRIPEQVYHDGVREWAASTIRESRADYTKYRKVSYVLPPHIFEEVQRQLTEQRIPFTLQTIAGRECLVINGNVYYRS